MRRTLTLALALSSALLASSICYGIWGVTDRGTWPKSWPDDLEPLRVQSRTLRHDNYTMYHIPFTDRAEFEAAWPHFLSVATDDTPVTLSRGHDRWAAVDFDAGVVVFTPNTGELMVIGDKETAVYPPGSESSIPGGKFLTVGPPWPDEIRNTSGELPNYVVPDGQKWRPTTIQEMRDDIGIAFRAKRVRTEIRLVVDGKIIDLNRIQLPESIIDKRFDENRVGSVTVE